MSHAVSAEHLRQALDAIDTLLELCWSSDRWTDAEAAQIEQAHALQEQLDAAYWSDHPFACRVTSNNSADQPCPVVFYPGATTRAGGNHVD